MNSTEYNQIVEYLQIASQSKYSNKDIKARFEAESAPTYGTNMALWIPDFEYAHQLLLESTALHLSTNAKGVELGAGSGRVSKLLLETFQDLQLTLVDLSTNMLNEAEKQLASYVPRCQFIVGDIFDADIKFPKGSLDYVVSVFAICHAQGKEVYEQLYSRIYDWLKPGGYFVCYDHVLGDTLALTALNALGWHRLLSAHQSVEQAKDGIVSTYQEDSPLSLREHLNLLSAVGFSAEDVLYKRDIFGMYAGIKQYREQNVPNKASRKNIGMTLALPQGKCNALDGWYAPRFCICLALGLSRVNGESRPTHRIADLADVYGYSDQAHLIREFKSFAHCTPPDFAASAPAYFELRQNEDWCDFMRQYFNVSYAG